MLRLLQVIAIIVFVATATGVLDLHAFLAHDDSASCCDDSQCSDEGGPASSPVHSHCVHCCSAHHLTIAQARDGSLAPVSTMASSLVGAAVLVEDRPEAIFHPPRA